MNSVHALFEAQVERTPDSIALVFEESRITYRDLNARAEALAVRLRALGVGPNVLVALYLERSIEMVVGLLGVLKAGGAYVPLDPRHPRKRLAYMLADARPRALVTHQRLRGDLPPHDAELVEIDADAQPGDEPHPGPGAARPDDLAYVIYTSGSTGEPKGVQIEHRSVLNLLASMRRRPGMTEDDVIVAITTLTFDIAVLEILLPLSCGARVVIAPSETAVDGAALAGLLKRCGATMIQATPSTLRLMLDSGWEGSANLKILCGGEAWTADLASQLAPRCKALWNMYGPTETTVWSAASRVQAGGPVLIGGPADNTSLYVLDDASKPSPDGTPGELFIGGEGLARGYLNRAELTAERFVADPFSPAPGARMYRTGDLVRRKPGGDLEFLGRLDHQVKIRGHRIELGEIEAVLNRQPGVAQSVVLAREDRPGDQRLVAYVAPTEGSAVFVSTLRERLGEALPAYMVPSSIVSMPSFPLTPNGKLDRKALPAPAAATPDTLSDCDEPRTPTEEVLVRIWREMLDVEHVGIRDNFFDLGGHSLLATRVIGRINAALNLRLRVPTFFQNPTIESLALILDQKQHVRPAPQLLPLRSGTSGPALYFIGAGPTETQIGRLSKADRAVYAIDIPMPVEWRQAIASGDSSSLPTLEELGELYSDLLFAHAGSRPCVIAGYSLWGKIAFETARALQRAGGEVAFVLLLDARAVYRRRTFSGAATESFRWIWRGEGPVEPRPRGLRQKLFESCRLALWLAARVPQAVKTRLTAETRLSGYLDRDGVPIHQTVINGLTHIVGASYRPRALDTSGVLIRATFPGEDQIPGYDLANGWSVLFDRGLTLVQAKGDHVTMVGEANLRELAGLIDGAFAS